MSLFEQCVPHLCTLHAAIGGLQSRNEFALFAYVGIMQFHGACLHADSPCPTIELAGWVFEAASVAAGLTADAVCIAAS